MDKKKDLYILVAVICIILIPIFVPGYIQSFDMAWGPHLKGPLQYDNVWFLYKTLNLLSFVSVGWFVQKLILISILTLSIFGAFWFLKTIINVKYRVVTVLGAVLYIFNPFFYTRLISGQWLVLLGYAFLPWAVRSIYIFLQNPTWRTAWPVALWTIAIGLSSIHTIGIIALVAIVLIFYSGVHEWKTKLKYACLILIAWIGANLFWLIPLVSGSSPVSQDISSFSRSEMEAFATQGTVAHSVPLSAALLTGFWADDQNRYILPSSLPVWWIGVTIIMTLVVIGIVLTFRQKNSLGITFFILAVIAWLLGMGIAWPPSAFITETLIKIIPYFNGYREPQKWLMLLALCYVYFAAIGANASYAFIKEKYKNEYINYAFITLLVIAPFLYAPTLAWGAAGQLKSVDYPRGWYDTKAYLNDQDKQSNTNKKDTNVLVFPWHIYLPISFTSRVVANPTGYFFDQTMITGDNFELAGVPPQNQTDTTKFVSNELVYNSINQVDVGQKLSQFDIQYVMLLKEADWQNYTWLDNQPDLEVVQDNQNIKLYKVKDK